jgi:hypothetical protein
MSSKAFQAFYRFLHDRWGDDFAEKAVIVVVTQQKILSLFVVSLRAGPPATRKSRSLIRNVVGRIYHP